MNYVVVILATLICREPIDIYSLEVKNLAMTLLSQMARALRIEDEEMKALFCNGVQSMRMNYYPPCPEPDMAIGFTPHSDADALTILYQLNETEGLQVRKDGKWVPVKPLQNAFVVNIGDIMEVMQITICHILNILKIASLWRVGKATSSQKHVWINLMIQFSAKGKGKATSRL